ncbi:FkbM family methyltransferase [Pseudomonadota bacterium]
MKMLKIVNQLINLLPGAGGERWIIDGGCNVGQFASHAIKEFPASNILSFEPDPDSWASAQKNIGFHNRIEIVEAALGAEIGRAEFFRGPSSLTNSLLPRPESDLKPYYPQQAVLNGGYFVDVVTIDGECGKRGIKEIDLLKLDLQGGELAALGGAETLLESDSVKVIIVEGVFVRKYHNQPLLWEIWEKLEGYGYTLYSLEDIMVGLYHSEEISMRHQQWNQCDAIFISSSLRGILDEQ